MYAGTQHSTGTQHRDGQGWWRSTGRLAAVIVLGLALASPAPGQAKTFHCGAGDVDCLIDAINEANANGNKNTIRLAAGIYTLTEADNGTTDNPNGLPVVTSPLTIQGAGATTTSIERDASAPDFRLLKVAATGTLTLTGLTLRGGSLAPDIGAAGIENWGTLTLTDSTLTDNRGLLAFGGIYNGGTLTLTNSILAYNLASNGTGGGIRNDGTATLTNSTLTGNVAGNSDGGGIYNTGTLTLTNSTLTGNAADNGGGIFNGGTLTLTNSTLTGNVAKRDGGGIFNGGTLTLTNSTLTGNVTIQTVTFPFDGNGGGICNVNGTLALTNSTLTGNDAEFGGGISNRSGSVTLQNTILALNTASDTSSHDCDGDITSLGTNVIGDPTACAIPLQTNDRTGDPGFGDFTENGQPGQGHVPLLPTSQAIDAGNDAVCPTRDQLGRPRMNIGGVGTRRCDIGAIEFQHRDNQQRDEALATAAQATP